MKKDGIKIAKNLEEALRDRQEAGVRFDNSSYWKAYYREKLKYKRISREVRYADFLVKQVSGKKVLDLASGYGFLPVELYKAGFEVTCVDRFMEMIKLAKAYFKKNNVDIRIVNSDVVELPLRDKLFDAVTAESIMEHLSLEEIEDKFIKEIIRVLKNDGLVLVHVPVKSLVTIFKKWYRLKIVRDLPEWAVDDDGDVTHKVWMTTDEYADVLKRNGLKVKYISYNFSRSNESMFWMRWINKFFSSIDEKFYRVDQNRILNNVFKMFCASTVFVCRKA